MKHEDRKLALAWYVAGHDLITIAQHFGLGVEELKQFLRTDVTFYLR